MKRRNAYEELRSEVFARDGLKCRYCGKTSRTRAGLHLDHVITFSKGGMTTAANLVELADLEAARSWAAIEDTGSLPDELRENFRVF